MAWHLYVKPGRRDGPSTTSTVGGISPIDHSSPFCALNFIIALEGSSQQKLYSGGVSGPALPPLATTRSSPPVSDNRSM